jgi:MFS transporter, PAT family, beta-lactamase induction signal transducer AmpG
MKRRFITLFLLGFSSGLPFCLVGSTLQAWFSSSAMSVMAVGMLGLIGQPYLYKFLWAPWMDRFSIGSLERRRGWIYLCQGGLISLLFYLSFFDPEQQPLLMSGIALLIAFFSASQDTVIDAYRTEILPERERGLGVAFFVTAYRIAIIISGGLTLVMAQYYGWAMTYRWITALMLLGVLGNYFAPATHPTINNEEKITLRSSLKALFQPKYQQKSVWLFVIFIFLYKIGEAFTSTTSSITMPLLIQGLHFDLATIGIVNKMGGIIAVIAGSFIAGILMLRLSLFRALMLFGIGQTFAVFIFIILIFTGKSIPLLVTAVVFDNFMSGMSTTALLALIMELCDQRFTATHFALLSAVAALPRILAGPLGGFLQSFIGWETLYIDVFFTTWLSLILLSYLFRTQSK